MSGYYDFGDLFVAFIIGMIAMVILITVGSLYIGRSEQDEDSAQKANKLWLKTFYFHVSNGDSQNGKVEADAAVAAFREHLKKQP